MKVVHVCWLLDPWLTTRNKYVAAWVAKGFKVHLWHLGQLGCDVADVAPRNARSLVEASPIAEAFAYEASFCVHAACADLFRYEVLLQHGGMYADLDVFPLNPPDIATEPRFEKDRRGKLEIRYLSAPKRHELVRELRDEAVRRETAFLKEGGYKTKRDLVNVLSRTGPRMAARVVQKWAEEHSTSYTDLLLPRAVNANTWENRTEHYSRRWTDVRERLTRPTP